MSDVLPAERVIAGTFGRVYSDGEWQTNVKSVKAEVEIQKSEIKRCGTRWIGHKVVMLKGTGEMNGFKVSSAMIQMVGVVATSSHPSAKTELIVKLDDPESYGCERIRLLNVSWDKITLANWTVGEVVEESTPFTFEGYEMLDIVVEG